MAPWKLEDTLAKTACWMLYKQDKHRLDVKDPNAKIWWTSAVLTDENPDRSFGPISVIEADRVFEELLHRDLIYADCVVVKHSQQIFEKCTVYFICEDQRKKWEDLATASLFQRRFVSLLKAAFGRNYFAWTILTFFVGKFFGKIIEDWADTFIDN